MTKLVLIHFNKAYHDIRAFLYRYVSLFDNKVSIVSTNNELKPVLSQVITKLLSDRQFTRASCYAPQLAFLTACINFTFTKKNQSKLINFLMSPTFSQILFGTKMNIRTNSELDQFISVSTNDS